MGAVVALPFLDAMVPALRAAEASKPVQRLGFLYSPNGIYPPSFHPEGPGGALMTTTPVLAPLEPVREHLNVIRGLSNIAAGKGGGGHTSAHSGWLNGTNPKKTEGSDIRLAKTLDQYAADKLGETTMLRSLELTTEANIVAGLCEFGYSCTYRNSTSWLNETTPLPHENNPRLVFERLFGSEATPVARQREIATDRSILDAVSEDMARLKRRLGVADRRLVNDYVGAVREIESRIQKIEKSRSSSPLPELARPIGVPEEFDEYAKLMLDLLVVAYQGDITRVSCTQIARENSGRTYPWVGVNGGHHSLSHHGGDMNKIEQQVKIDTYHMTLLRYLVEKMRDTPDGEGSLLDHSIMFWGWGLGDGAQHTFRDLPVITAGHGAGQLKTGRHIRVTQDTPLMNAGLSLLDKVGVNIESIGDSTGRLSEL
jgi:hypothetical protein